MSARNWIELWDGRTPHGTQTPTLAAGPAGAGKIIEAWHAVFLPEEGMEIAGYDLPVINLATAGTLMRLWIQEPDWTNYGLPAGTAYHPTGWFDVSLASSSPFSANSERYMWVTPTSLPWTNTKRGLHYIGIQAQQPASVGSFRGDNLRAVYYGCRGDLESLRATNVNASYASQDIPTSLVLNTDVRSAADGSLANLRVKLIVNELAVDE